MQHSALTCSINLQSATEIFPMVVESCFRNELKYESGEIIRKTSKTELAFLHVTLRIDQFYSPYKVSYNILNGY